MTSKRKDRLALLELGSHIEEAPSPEAVKLAKEASAWILQKWQLSCIVEERNRRWPGASQRDALEQELWYLARALVKAKKVEEFDALAERRSVLIDDANLYDWSTANFFLRSGRHGLETVDQMVQFKLAYAAHVEEKKDLARKATQDESIALTLKAATDAISKKKNTTKKSPKPPSNPRAPSDATPTMTRSKSSLTDVTSLPLLPLTSSKEEKQQHQ